MSGLGWRKFAAGEVLTANNFQSYAVDQSVQRYAGTAARGSAIGTAVSEGMMSWLDDSNVVQAYDGSAWNSLAYASSVSAIPRVGLTPIIPTQVDSGSYDSTTGLISFSNVSAVRARGIFTSAYAFHRVVLRIRNVGATGNYSVQGRLSAAGVESSVNYDNAAVGFLASTGGSQNLQGMNATQVYWGRIYDSGVECLSVIDISSAAFAEYTTFTGNYIGSYPSDLQQTITGARHRVATAYDGLYLGTGVASTGTMKVYGYN